MGSSDNEMQMYTKVVEEGAADDDYLSAVWIDSMDVYSFSLSLVPVARPLTHTIREVSLWKRRRLLLAFKLPGFSVLPECFCISFEQE